MSPSLLRTLVVRLTLVVLVALACGYANFYLEFRVGLMGLEGQSIAVQVQDLRAAIVAGADGPQLVLPLPLRDFYAQPDTLNGYQLLRTDGTVIQSGGFVAPYLPQPAVSDGATPIMQHESDPQSGGSVVAAALPVQNAGALYWVRVVRNLDDTESLAAQLMLDALVELIPTIVVLLIAVIGVVIVTVLTSLRSLRTVSRQAAALSANRLSERLHAPKLPQEVVQLVNAVNIALDRLEADYRAQRDFTAHAAHELRTPLATLRARLDSRFTNELGDVSVELDQLGRLVEQLLCLAQVEAGVEFESTPFDAFAIALDMARDLAPGALASDHVVAATTPEASVPTHGNATLARLVFRNLIGNAIQHTPPGTSITVSAPDAHTIVIEDDGPGIAVDEVPFMFDRFRRGRSAVGFGAGLGLAIAKRIMAREGGDLILDTHVVRGVRLRVVFRAP